MSKRLCVLRWAATGSVMRDRLLVVMRTFEKTGSNREEGLGPKNMAVVTAGSKHVWLTRGMLTAHTHGTIVDKLLNMIVIDSHQSNTLYKRVCYAFTR